MTSHQSTEGDTTNISRRANLSTLENGEDIGACLFLTREDIIALGVDPDMIDWLNYEVDEEAAQLEISGGKND